MKKDMLGVIETDRITIEPISKYDIDWFIQAVDNEYIYEFFEYRKPTNDLWKDIVRKRHLAIIEQCNNKGVSDVNKIRLIIRYKKSSNTRVGSIILIEELNGSIEIGYWLDRSYSGLGICTEAVKAVVDRYSALGKEIVAKIQKKNTKSIKVVESCGFEKKSEYKDINGEDTFIFVR